MQRPVPKENIKGLECKHAVYCPSSYSNDDLLFVKENIHTKDGKIIPFTYMIKNYKKKFWVTKEGFRNHKDKKEWEDVSKLREYTSTQAKLSIDISRALGLAPKKQDIRRIARSPFLYGADITTPTLLKKQYQENFPDCISPNTVAVLDIETDVVHGHERPIYAAITFRDKAIITTTKEFVGNIHKFEEKLMDRFHRYLGEYIKTRNISLEIKVCENAGEACYEVIKKAHEWRPDFLTVWNIDFDIPRISKTLKDHGYNLAEVFSDPSVPSEFKFFKYTQGEAKKTTASGKVTPIHPADRWHVAECPASFYLMDSMCVYKRIRLAAQNEPSYSLDEQLNNHLGVRKLKFAEADGLTGLDWHIKMQSEYKVEYGVYNLFDCIGVELFDEKVKDLSVTISVLNAYSEYKIFNSQPKRLIDQFYFFCLSKNKVLASCSDQMKDELDVYSYSMNNWVITLPSYLTIENGLPIIEERPDINTMVRTNVADLDVSAAYPTTQIILNISKETTYRELCKVRGVGDIKQRFAGINLTGNYVNAVEITQSIFKAPKFDKLLAEFNREQGIV